MGRGEMKVEFLVPGQPAIVFGLVGIQVVQDHVDHLPIRMLGDDTVHEVQELDPTAAPINDRP